MDCSKLSANIAAATCRTGRIDVRELMLINWDDWQKYQRGFDSSWAGRLVADTRVGVGMYRTAGVPALVGDTFTFYAVKPEGVTVETYRLALYRKTKRSTSGYEVIFDAQAQAWDTPATYTVRADYASEDGMYYVGVVYNGATIVVELEGQTVPPLFKVTMGGTAGEKGSVVTSSEQTQTRSAGGYPYNYIYLSRGIESTFGKVLTAAASTPVAIVHFVNGAASIRVYSDVQQGGVYTVRWADFVGEEYFIGTAEPSTEASYDLSQHRYEDKSGIASEPIDGGYAAGAFPVNSSDVLRAKGPEGVYGGYSVEYATPAQTDTAQTRGTWALLYHVRWNNAIFRPYSDVEGTPLQWQVIYADVEAPDVTKLNISDGITYPPVVSLLATHERGIVSFAEEVKGAYLNGYAHRIQFTAFDRKQSVKDVLNILGRGRFVALARYEQDGEDVVVVYGADCGMVAEAETFDSSNTDGEIGQAVLATDEGCMESVPMLTLEPSGSLATVAEAWEWLKEHAFG